MWINILIQTSTVKFRDFISCSVRPFFRKVTLDLPASVKTFYGFLLLLELQGHLLSTILGVRENYLQ